MKAKPELPNINTESPNMNAAETFGQAVEGFQTNASDPLSEQLELFLKHVAKTGDILFDWERVQKIFIHKMKLVLNDFYQASPYEGTKVNPNLENDKFEDMRERVVQLASEFDCPPFTFQRLCELVTDPKRNYTKCEKFIRAVEKNLMVVSPWSYATRKTSETNEQVNGGFDMRAVNSTVERPWSNLPPSPVTTNAPAIPTIKVTNSEGVAVNESNESETDSTSTETGAASEQAMETSTAVESSEMKDAAKTEDTKGVSSQSEGPSQESGCEEKAPPAEMAEEAKPEQTEEKIEPLPGVGTLVEKHNVNKQANSDNDTAPDVQTETAQDDSSTENPATDEARAKEAGHDQLPDQSVASRSPKRKLSDDEATPMEVSSPTKRPKHDGNGSGDKQVPAAEGES